MRLIDANALCKGLVSNHPVVIAAKCAPVITLNTLRDAIYEDAVAHGLWEKTDGPMECAFKISDEYYELACAAMDLQNSILNFSIDESEALSHYSEELADVIIMCLSVAGKLGIDIDAAVKRKMQINRERPWKHGKEDACNT